MTALVLPLALSLIQWVLLLGFIVPVLVLWGYALTSLVRRPDLDGVAKTMWLAAIILLPLLGSAVYFMLRPTPGEQRRRAEQRGRG